MVSLYVNSFCAPPSATAAGPEKMIPGGFPRRSAFWMDTGGIGHNFLFSWRWSIKNFYPPSHPRDQERDAYGKKLKQVFKVQQFHP